MSTGASNDLERVSKIARDMITVYGMSTRVPNLSLVDHQEGRFLGFGPARSARSDKLEQMIDEEVSEIIQGCYEQGKALLAEKRDQLEKMARTLLEKEKIDEADVTAILGARSGSTPGKP